MDARTIKKFKKDFEIAESQEKSQEKSPLISVFLIKSLVRDCF